MSLMERLTDGSAEADAMTILTAANSRVDGRMDLELLALMSQPIIADRADGAERLLAALWSLGFACAGFMAAVETKIGAEPGWAVECMGLAFAREWPKK